MDGVKFQKALGDLIDTEIGLYLNDRQFIEGVLLDVKHDHIVVYVSENVFYFGLENVQTISINTKDFPVSTKNVHYVDKNYLVDVLTELKNNWVAINSMSDQALFGVLSKVSDDHITVINNSELHYIQKNYISNFKSNISEEQIIQINKREQIKFKDCQIVTQSTTEYPKEINEIERITNIEIPALKVSSRKVADDENVANEKPEDHLKTRLEVYATLVRLLKQSILNRDVDDERRKNIIQGLITHPNEEEKGQTDSSTEEKMELENVVQETPKVLSSMVKPDQSAVLEKNNRFSSEEKFLLTESKAKRKKKKVLLKAWSTMNNEQDPITNPNNLDVENELPDYEGDIIKLEQPSDPDKLLIQPLRDQYPNDNFVALEEKRKSTEVIAAQLPINHISPKEVKKILEKQYLSLMKHAETNVFLFAARQSNLSEEAQYLALLKHAENMYRELKN